METSLIIPAFIAGLLTFLAPCTLPLLPGFLGFISGATVNEGLQTQGANTLRRRMVVNALWYIAGFSGIFIALGTLFGLGGTLLFQYRELLGRIGGLIVIFFGLYMTGLINLSFLNYEKRIHLTSRLVPGRPLSSFLFGAIFAFGWTPCVGPVLGAVLTLAASSATVGTGALLLLVFSAGLAVPFLLTATLAGSAFQYIHKLNKYLRVISIVGGVFLIFIGVLLLTNQFSQWASVFYKWFNILNYDKLLEYL